MSEPNPFFVAYTPSWLRSISTYCSTHTPLFLISSQGLVGLSIPPFLVGLPTRANRWKKKTCETLVSTRGRKLVVLTPWTCVVQLGWSSIIISSNTAQLFEITIYFTFQSFTSTCFSRIYPLAIKNHHVEIPYINYKSASFNSKLLKYQVNVDLSNIFHYFPMSCPMIFMDVPSVSGGGTVAPWRLPPLQGMLQDLTPVLLPQNLLTIPRPPLTYKQRCLMGTDWPVG
jgi:hypothetical protein